MYRDGGVLHTDSKGAKTPPQDGEGHCLARETPEGVKLSYGHLSQTVAGSLGYGSPVGQAGPCSRGI